MCGIVRGAVGVVIVSAALLGCGPGKELPDASLKGKLGPAPEPSVTIPVQSEDAAKKVVDRLLKSSSGGDVSRIEKITAFRSTARGTMRRLVGTQMVPVDTTRDFEAKWPNACRARVESPNMQLFTMGLRRPMLWVREGNEFKDFRDPKHIEEITAFDLVGQHWMLLLVPLAGPKTIVFDAVTRPVGDKTADVFKAAVPGYPVFTLTVNPAGHLSRVEYSNLEIGSQVTKELTLGEHKQIQGVMLPTQVEFVRNGDLVERWTMAKWEIVDHIDDSVFDVPK